MSVSSMNSSADSPAPLLQYGGQAVLEGVMMRGKKAMAVAVRKPDGSISTKVTPLGGIYRSPVAKIPILRGILMLWDALGLGLEGLSYSAEVQGEKPLGKGEWLTALTFSLLAFVGLFFLLPVGIAQGLESLLGISAPLGNIVEGVVRLILLLLYIYLIGLMPDIARWFAYHGAEHKTINAYEAGAELAPESVASFPREHPRCGTSFLIVVAVLAVVLFALLGPMGFLERVLTRLIGIPVLVALGYEYLRLTSFFRSRRLARILVAPGMWAQRLTTREPDLAMIEVAIAAFQAMRSAEETTA